jgi:hypothetical protein
MAGFMSYITGALEDMQGASGSAGKTCTGLEPYGQRPVTWASVCTSVTLNSPAGPGRISNRDEILRPDVSGLRMTTS